MDKLKFKIVDNSNMIYLECNGGYDVGYMKPLKRDKNEIIQEFKDRIKQYNGELIEKEKKYVK